MNAPWSRIGVLPAWKYASTNVWAWVEFKGQAPEIYSAFAAEKRTHVQQGCTGMFEPFRGPYQTPESAVRNAVAFGCDAFRELGLPAIADEIRSSVFGHR